MRTEILGNEEISPEYFLMTLHCPEIAAHARPGNFIMMRISPGYQPLLRRPFSIHDLHPVQPGGRGLQGITILYKVRGVGTLMMSQMKPGDRVDTIGPLGNSFPLTPDAEGIVMVAGGAGIAPFLFLTREILKLPRAGGRAEPFEMHLFCGGKGKGDLLLLDRFANLGATVHATTEDGSAGFQGMVSDRFEEFIKERELNRMRPGEGGSAGAGGRIVYACGPDGMLKAVAGLAGSNCYVSLERRMGCGMGACLGCVFKVKTEAADPSEHSIYLRVCRDGPIFPAKIVNWEE